MIRPTLWVAAATLCLLPPAAAALEPASVLAEEDPDSDRHRLAAAYLLRERSRIAEALDEAVAATAHFFDLQGIRW